MLKKLVIMLLQLLPFLSMGQKAIIDENKEQYNRQYTTDFYECKVPEFLFEEGLAVIEFINKETLYVKNETNTGSSGIHISFKIDKEMNVCDLKYYTWDDVEDGSTTDFSVKGYEIRLNKNPFKSGISNLKGAYFLDVKSEYYQSEIVSKEKVKPKIETFTYKALFECK